MDSSSKYPRTLHVGYHPIGSPTNSGLTLASMFGDWPSTHLEQLCLRNYGQGEPRFRVVDAPPSVAPLDALVRRVLGRAVGSAGSDGLNNSISRRGDSIPLRRRLRTLATVSNDIGPVHLPRNLIQELEAFEPEVLHSLLGGVRQMRLAVKVSRALRVPLVPHFMDDWVDNLFADGQWGGLARKAVESSLDDVLDLAPLCLTIGEAMASEYEERLGRPCVVVGNSVDFAEYASLGHAPASPRNQLIMKYIGGLHLGRAEVVRRIASTIDGASPHLNWRLELHVPDADLRVSEALASDFACVVNGGSLRPTEVAGALVTADALLFLESDDPRIQKFTRLSVSTKVPQYLASKVPIVVVGPEGQGSVEAFARSGAAWYAGNGREPELMIRALTGITKGVTQSMTRLDPRELERKYGVAATRERLRNALATAAEQRSS